jgi:hypothetical protein
MISEKLVKLIEDNADELTKSWLRDVRGNPTTPAYQTFPEEKLYQQATSSIVSSATGYRERPAVKSADVMKRVRNVSTKVCPLRSHQRHHPSQAPPMAVLSDGRLSTALELYQSPEQQPGVLFSTGRSTTPSSGTKTLSKTAGKVVGKIFGSKEEEVIACRVSFC